MIKIMDKFYMLDKEAAMRYGYSAAWFRKMRSLDIGPKYIQVINGGRVLYPLEATDEWFENRMKEKE